MRSQMPKTNLLATGSSSLHVLVLEAPKRKQSGLYRRNNQGVAKLKAELPSRLVVVAVFGFAARASGAQNAHRSSHCSAFEVVVAYRRLEEFTVD